MVITQTTIKDLRLHKGFGKNGVISLVNDCMNIRVWKVSVLDLD